MKTKYLDDSVILHKIQGFGDECIDMPANDFQYHASCMHTFMNKRKPSDQEEKK